MSAIDLPSYVTIFPIHQFGIFLHIVYAAGFPVLAVVALASGGWASGRSSTTGEPLTMVPFPSPSMRLTRSTGAVSPIGKADPGRLPAGGVGFDWLAGCSRRWRWHRAGVVRGRRQRAGEREWLTSDHLAQGMGQPTGPAERGNGDATDHLPKGKIGSGQEPGWRGACGNGRKWFGAVASGCQGPGNGNGLPVTRWQREWGSRRGRRSAGN